MESMDLKLNLDGRVVELSDHEIDVVSGGFVCGGLCIIGAIGAGAGLVAAGIAIGGALHDAFHQHMR